MKGLGCDRAERLSTLDGSDLGDVCDSAAALGTVVAVRPFDGKGDDMAVTPVGKLTVWSICAISVIVAAAIIIEVVIHASA